MSISDSIDTVPAAAIPFAERLAVSVDEFALQSGLSRATVYRKIDDGEIPAFQVGGRRLLLVADAIAWLTKTEVTPRAVADTGDRHTG